jgi:hypothetical protein
MPSRTRQASKLVATLIVRALVAGYVAALAAGPAATQQTSAETPAIRVQSSLVLVDVITADPRNGLPIRDLHKEDFQLFDNGQRVAIATFDAGAQFETRPAIVWLVAICNEQGKTAGSANYFGKEALFRPALDRLNPHDLVGVAHWCDNGETDLDLAPTEDRDRPIRALAETITPIAFQAGTSQADEIGEATFRKMIRLIIQDAHRRKPQPLPVIVFLDGDHTGQPIHELNQLVDDFLETTGIVFGIKDSGYGRMWPLIGEQAQILHYMAKHTGGEYFTASPAEYSGALEQILTQLHFRYEIGFIPSALDGKRHALRLELTKQAREKHKGARLRFRIEYIPLAKEPDWAR